MYWSPDSSWLALVCSFEPESSEAVRLAIVDAQKMEIRKWADLPDKFLVHDIAWSPDSKYLAVLAEKRRIDKADLLSILFSRPVTLSDYELLIYSKGKSSPELSLPLAQDVRKGFCGSLKWH
jgi:hypothetical protein